ncbi:hypothetical protein BDZ94DRAFT_1316083 [Collybia nuda]|uniref:Uncharacterized protein n=1 Tax=Collybia nuda TaxID=64659 RepID=A0A9P5XQ94_9AGAR|nr:hypothetical protein BDZ94DRAFT_1316083 [Collybia nuda]
MATHHTVAPFTKEIPRGSRIFTQIFPQRSSQDRDRKLLRQPPNPPNLNIKSPSSVHPLSLDNITTGRNPILTNSQPNSSSIENAHRARRIQLEAQLRAAEQELREMGVDSQRGPPGPNVPPAMLQTNVYIEYRRLQGEIEEPPPQYSELV